MEKNAVEEFKPRCIINTIIVFDEVPVICIQVHRALLPG